MIRSIQIKNFMCLRDMKLDLHPLTVIIGQNDTGKTSLLEAIRTLAQLASPQRPELKGNWAVNKLAWSGADPCTIDWIAEVDPTRRNGLPGRLKYHLQIAPAQRNDLALSITAEAISVEGSDLNTIRSGVGQEAQIIVREGPHGAAIREYERQQTLLAFSASYQTGFHSLRAAARALSTTSLYRFDPARLAESSYYEVQPYEQGSEPYLHADGQGLPSALDILLGSYRSAFNDIESGLREFAPFVKSIRLKPGRTEKGTGKSIAFELNTGAEVAMPLMSDGVRLCLAYLTLLHAPSTPGIVLLEEPENGVHPRALQSIARALQRLTDASRGDTVVQVILTTHSPYLLDFVPPQSVIVFGRKKSGESVAAPLLTLPGVEERLASGFSLGEMWFNVGEEQLLGDRLK
jgi:predicted ATPase